MIKRKKKLIWQIFPWFLIITILSLSTVTSYSTRYFKQFFLKNSEKDLTIRTRLLLEQFSRLLVIQPVPTGQIDSLCKKIGKQTLTRVTVILPSGKVVGDSFGNIAVMENHARRPEIVEALKRETGVSVRYSETLDKNMLYIALPLMNEGRVIAVIRTSISISTVDKEIERVRNNIFLTMLLTVLAAAVASLYVARRIAKPVEELKNGADRFARGQLDEKLVLPDTQELSELAGTMNQMAANLDDKIEQIRRRRMELEAVHSSMQEGVIAVDKHERIITINRAAAQILGFSSEELTSRAVLEVISNLELLHFVQRALATQEPVEDDITLLGTRDLILNVHSTALYEKEDVQMGTLIILRDITRIRRLERMHKDFAANVSHELKTPLTTIKGFIETIQDTLEDDRKDESIRFVKIIDKNVNRMVDLINDLLALSRLERLQGTEIIFENQNINALLQVVINTCSHRIREKQMILHLDCPEDLSAMVDASLLEQALINLVDNAVKYSPEGKTVTITAREKENGYIDIVVEDEGPGIGKDHLSKIFNRFYRVDKARSRHAGGTGLGLAIVKHIVQYHRGNIDVKSVKGQGSSFKISLPS